MDEAVGAAFALRRVPRGCMVVAFAVVLAGLSLIGLSAPVKIARADPPACAPGWVWSPNLNQCVFWLPTANGPGGPGGTGRAGWPRGTGWPRPALNPSPPSLR